MNLGKGLAFSAVGALAGAVVWIILVKITGWSLWVLAPIVGGAAGFGMMRATQMKGGPVAGVGAAAMTLVAIFGARYFIVSQDVQARLAVSEDDAYAMLVGDVAERMEQRGLEVYDDDGEYVTAVRRKAKEVWSEMSELERSQYAAARQRESDEAAGMLTPLGLLFDFGIFGTICAALAAGTAFKTGSAKLEDTLVERGLAAGGEDAAGLAAKMRSEDSPASSAGRWCLPMQAADERPLPKIKLPSSEDGAAAGRDLDRKVA